MTTNATPWSPPIGRLFVTTYTDPGHEQACRLNCIDPATWKPPMHLCYRLTDETRFPCAVILQGSQERAAWRTGPAEYVAFDTEPARYVSETGIVVERRLATDDDLRAMFSAWRVHGFTLEQWLMSVRLPRWQRTDYAPIDVDDLQRMARIIAEVQQPVPPTAEEREAHRRDAVQATNDLVRTMRAAGTAGEHVSNDLLDKIADIIGVPRWTLAILTHDGHGQGAMTEIAIAVIPSGAGNVLHHRGLRAGEIAALMRAGICPTETGWRVFTPAEQRDAFCLDAARSTIERVRVMVGARYDEATTDAVARALRREGSEG